jgi:hypothetical protein
MVALYLAPSFYAHIMQGFLIFCALYITIIQFPRMDRLQTIFLLLLFSITIGIHGISHMGLETKYNYNPLSQL